jgi:hypothetical protein
MNYFQLVADRTYIVKREKDNKTDIIKGIFVSTIPDSLSILMRSMKTKSIPGIQYYGLCHKTDRYYDWDKIRYDAQNARNNFEQRALNQILKRLVNEEFEW